ncbi:MAG: DNA translocase FtsK [Syntrophobacterales bacterium]|nr:DNA translocase FtsK [Syntrophobacterales bacterium]HNS53642.1 DNA translocase FtsK [Syntrophales bacterium]
MAERKPIQGRAREIAGVVLFALAVFLFLSVISYSPADPSLSNYETSRAKISNVGGIIGSYVADLLIRFLGLSAYWLPLFLLITSVKLFLDAGFLFRPGWIGGFVGLVVTTSGLFAHAYKLIPLVDTPFAAGGFAGTLLSEYLNALFNPGGTFILLFVGLVISLIVTVDLSVVTALRKAYGVARSTGRGVRSYVEIGREKVTDYLREDEAEEREAPRKAERRPPPVIREERAPAKERTRKKKVEQTVFEFARPKGAYILPPLTLLDDVPRRDTKQRRENLMANARLLEKKLADFGVEGRVSEVKPGPVITMYELEPAPGVKINRIANLSDDLALALKAQSVRIVAPIPGKAAIGIEIPNAERDAVTLRDAVDNEAFAQAKHRLPIALGEDITGTPVIADLTRMPHLLIAGTTGSGKSVFLNALICSLLFKAPPDEVKFLMIDPKRLELAAYEGLPHLLHPVVVDPKEAASVLRWAVEEMENRYRIIGETGEKSIDKFNRFVEKKQQGRERILEEAQARLPMGEAEEPEPKPLPEKLPYLVIVIDELADLMMVAQRNVEESLTRLAQMARASGIHIILATQRPSVDVITGIIKANFPTRISFQVSSKVDSRTILDQLGAEHLLGQGDMLFMPPGTSKLQRIHGAFVSDREISRIVSFIRKQEAPVYDESIQKFKVEAQEGEKAEGDIDEKYDEAVELVTELGQASVSLVQRYLKVGYNRAARMIERMEKEGVVGPSDGVKPRKVLARKLPR